MQGSDWGWSAPVTLTVLAGGTILLFAFFVIETRKAAPLIEMRLFRDATFIGANLAIFTGQFGKVSAIVFIAVYLQHVLRMSPLDAGLAMLVAPLILWSFTLPLLYVPTRRAVMASVPEADYGEAGGISLTAQLLGGTIGMAVSGTLLAITGNYPIIFLTSGILAMVILVIAWITVKRQRVDLTSGQNPRHRAP